MEWFEWKLSLVNMFKEEITKFLLHPRNQESWKWKGDESESYIVKSTYKSLQNNIDNEKDEFFRQL